MASCSKKTLPATKSDRMRKVRPMSDELRHEIETFAPRTRPRHITLVMHHPNPSRTRRGVIKIISGHLPSRNPNRGLAFPVRHTWVPVLLACRVRRHARREINSGHHLLNGHHTWGARRTLYALGSQIWGVWRSLLRCMELIREFTELWGALHHFPPPPPFPEHIAKAIRESKRSPD
ncbi:hypothetical protein PAPYR_4735 [Paratrimastix pyriformis]|uniref:Uncharacterized protein n=1 Tax=Paratrimastix pyriformis TaxID=342808 RepID=A0ABQ8UNC7_9EUKA|nr:hypothetical protein PAPYR_4735 [Paratrimastix pyriformis]